MTDYKIMYTMLFNSITDIIEELQKVQQLTEEIYMKENENVLKFSLLEKEKRNNNFTVTQK